MLEIDHKKRDFSFLKGKKIFLVEDDAFFTKIIKQKLFTAGCEFQNALSGDESLKLLESATPDLILLDILLPGGVDGFGVLRNIKSNQKLKHVPVIILSNLSETKDIERGMELGAFRYIVKSTIDPDEILDHVTSALNSIVK